MNRLCLSLAALTVLGLWLPASGEEAAPYEVPLEGQRIAFDLANLDLEVEVRAGAEPLLQARPLADGVEPAAILEVTTRGNGVTVSRRDQPEPKSRDLALRVTLDLTQALSIHGRELNLALRAEVADDESLEVEEEAVPETDGEEEQPAPETTEEPAATEPTPAPGKTPVTIDVAESEVVLTGVDGGTVTLEAGSLVATGCQGQLTISASGGPVEVRGYDGSLRLAGREAELTISDGRGPVNLELEGGSLFASQGRGPVSGRGINARVQLEGWEGAPTINGQGTTIEIRRSRGLRATTSGENLDVTVEGWRGALTARLGASSLRGSGWSGAAEVTARNGTSVDLSDLNGPLTLSLLEGSTATLNGVNGELKANVADSSFEGNQLRIIGITARQSRVTIGGATRISELTVVDGELDADLSPMRGKATVTLMGRSHGRFRLSEPCLVRTIGPAGMLGAGATVSGCDQRLSGQRKRRHARSLEGDVPAELKLVLDADASADVTGYP